MKIREVTENDVFDAISQYQNGKKPNPYGEPKYWFLRSKDDATLYPLKTIWALAANLDRNEFKCGKNERIKLEKLGFDCVNTQKFVSFNDYPDEISDQLTSHFEGAMKTVVINTYERDSAARRKCIAHYGATCQVCELDFAKKYGPRGEGFIHVHHIVPISTIGESYQVDPIKDLIPVCPNCHAMIHRERENTLSVKDLRQLLTDELEAMES